MNPKSKFKNISRQIYVTNVLNKMYIYIKVTIIYDPFFNLLY